MSFAFGEIRQERHDCYSVFYEGGLGVECRRTPVQLFPTFREAAEWMIAKDIEVMTPKIKKPVEPVYVPELDDLAMAIPDFDHHAVAHRAAAELIEILEAPEPAEAATGDQAASAEALRDAAAEDIQKLQDEGWPMPKRRGRPPKVSA